MEGLQIDRKSRPAKEVGLVPAGPPNISSVTKVENL